MHLVDHCIHGALKGKTRFLVTHHLHLLPSCDKIVILEKDGTVKVSGTFDEIMKSGIEVEQYLGSKEDNQEGEEGEGEGKKTKGKNGEAEKISGDDKEKKDVEKDPKAKSPEKSESGALLTKEERKEGNVSTSTYTAYFKAGGVWAFVLTIFFQLGCQVLGIEANFWLADWGKEV